MRHRTAKRRRRKKTFKASITALMPGTLQKTDRRRHLPRRSATKRRPQTNIFSKLQKREWRSSHFAALLLALLSLIALELGITDAAFAVTNPVIKNNHLTDTQQILSQTDLEQANIFVINPADVSRRLETFIPQIKEAHVRLGLPNKIIIRITEREPLVVYQRAGQISWLDEEGRLFPAAEQRPDLLRLIDEDGSASPDGQHIDPGLIRSIQRLSAGLTDIQEFHYQTDYGLFFISPEGWRVYLGDAKDMETKLARWQAIHQQLLQENRSVSIIDLRYAHIYIQ